MGNYGIKDCTEEIYDKRSYHQDFSYHIEGCRKNSVENSILSMIELGDFLNDYLSKYFSKLENEIKLSNNPQLVIKSHEDELKMIKSKLIKLRKELSSIILIDNGKQENLLKLPPTSNSPIQ